MNDRYDNVLIGILQNEGEIAGFLDAVLGFLYRRTDFYRIMKSKTDKMGFPSGTALNLLVNAFKKYENLAIEDEKQRERKRDEEARKRDRVKENTLKEQQKSVSDKNLQTVEVASQKEGKSQDIIVDSNQSPPSDVSRKQYPPDVNQKTDPTDQSDKSKETASGDNTEDPELTRQQALFQSNPESYNGAIRDNYSWSQSITDLDIHVKIPNYIKKGKDLKVLIEKKHVKVSYRDQNGQFVEVMNGDLSWEINKEESMWNLVPGEHILINLDKKQERWWEAVLTKEPKINVRKIDASRPMTDLDDEAQSKIEEMMFNERQKKLGLPQTHEKKVHDVLSQAWNAEGSPFKGTAFDPSKITVGQSGMISINDNESHQNP